MTPGYMRMKYFLSAFSLSKNINRLFMRPESNYPVLDGFRALSMMMIIIFHVCTLYCIFHPNIQLIDVIENQSLMAWVWNSDKSVDVFFVISGFLITGILLKQVDEEGRIRFGHFYLRRFLRLSPAYWFVMVAYIAFHLPNTDTIWANFLYVNNFISYDKQAMNWTWTLAIEEQFYLLYPMVLMILIRKTRHYLRWMWALLGLSFVLRFVVIILDDPIRTSPLSRFVLDWPYHVHYFSVVYDNFYTRFGALVCGCIAGAYYHHRETSVRIFLNTFTGRTLKLACVLAIALIMAIPVVGRNFDHYQFFTIAYQVMCRNVFSGSVAFLALTCLEGGMVSRMVTFLFSNRFWYPLAQLSYSMYLCHMFFISSMVQLAMSLIISQPERFGLPHWQAMTLITIVCTFMTVLTAAIIYLLIERPIMNLRK